MQDISVDVKRRWFIPILERINNNGYKVDLPSEYGINAAFNVSDLFLFDIGKDSRQSSFKEIGDSKGSIRSDNWTNYIIKGKETQ